MDGEDFLLFSLDLDIGIYFSAVSVVGHQFPGIQILRSDLMSVQPDGEKL